MLLLHTLRPSAYSARVHLYRPPRSHLRLWPRTVADYRAKYAEKLENVAQQQGTSVEELRAHVRERQREQERRKAVEAEARSAERLLKEKQQDVHRASTPRVQRPLGSSVRKDSSPIKPLSGILNTERLLSKPHTAAQVSALWTAFHASRSGGTGRGFLCASLPRETYDSLLGVAQRYPNSHTHANDDDESKTGYEFYVLQWDFYHAPPPPLACSDPFSPEVPRENGEKAANPRLATAIFTPLLEYKLRQTFATPYLVLTFYSELASSHGLVLMRGEITPSAATKSNRGDHLLSQGDAQLLAHGLQRFYLWGSSEEREKLLSDFHERPGAFKWEELLKHGDFGV
ncbi:ATP11 protein-domain-containing protein [Russula compacta]|nr:ATP11 protein-domain-containing protein [Russula compacta]